MYLIIFMNEMIAIFFLQSLSLQDVDYKLYEHKIS